MIATVRHAEGIAHAAGWDNAPVLLLVNNTDGGEFLAVSPAPHQPVHLDDDPVVGLAISAAALESMNVPLDPLVADSFAAFVWLHEGWSISMELTEKYPDRDPVDIPGAREVRQCIAVDCGGRYYQLTRVRGEEPELMVLRAGDERQPGGPVVHFLIRMVRAASMWAPPDSKNLEKLDALLAGADGP